MVLGPTGRNFAAGMSGGVAYVLAPNRETFELNCNLAMVNLEDVVEEDDIGELAELIRQHHESTGSTIAIRVLEKWDQVLPQFVKVIPTDYQRVLNEQAMRDIYDTSSDKRPLDQKVAG